MMISGLPGAHDACLASREAERRHVVRGDSRYQGSKEIRKGIRRDKRI